ncbi:MAG: hypothetical protein ACYC3G_00970 [Minisyncoccota bacterium]
MFEQLLVSVGPIVLTALSLFVSMPKNGGTIKYISFGWPHFFYVHYLEDILDKTPIDKWCFISGRLFSYLVSNYVFYLSFIFLAVVLVKIFKNKNRRHRHHK